MKRAFLVFGPESSGTRLVTSLLVDAGCFGDRGHDQRLDKRMDSSWEVLEPASLPTDDTAIVWRRSFPHGGKWVSIPAILGQLRRHGYDVFAVVTTRDWFPMIQSQKKEHAHVTSDLIATENIRKAYLRIFSCLTDVPFLVVSYESLAQYRWKAVSRMLEVLGLEKPPLVERIEDGNAKWYEPREKMQSS